MATYAFKKQYKNIVENLINQQPVRVNMTFSTAFVIPRKVVVTVLCFKRLSVRQPFYDVKQLIKIITLLFSKLQIFLNCPVNLISYFICQALP